MNARDRINNLYSRKQRSSLREAWRVILHTVFWGGLWTALGVGAYQLWVDLHNPALLPIREVVIVGKHLHVSKAELEKAVNSHLGGTLLTLKESELKADLMQFPWVENVSIRRVWPGELKIKITPQDPVAQWGHKSLMNSHLELFSPSLDSFPKDLPVLFGPKGSQAELWKEYQYLNKELLPLKLSVQTLNLSSRHSWSLRLSNGIKVILGRDEIELRLKRLIKIYPRLFAPKAEEIAQIDLRYPNGFAVKWKG